MQFLEAPPNTNSYMIAGFAVIFGVILIYLASLFIRYRLLQHDLKILEDLDKKGKKG
jgi:hypothetical protein